MLKDKKYGNVMFGKQQEYVLCIRAEWVLGVKVVTELGIGTGPGLSTRTAPEIDPGMVSGRGSRLC